MLPKETICGYEVKIDRAATAAWYSTAGEWGCACGHCRNFLHAAKMNALPAYMTTLLKKFDLSPEKATYVGQLYTDSEGVHYQVSYRVAGELLGESCQEDKRIRCCHEIYPYGAPGFPEPHFDLEFYLTLPWVLEENENHRKQ
ncbi:MAG: hypothetical protein IKA58_01920 [Clostridia bacterium]|nr:hypothetical protein [Clostridia bacterium]